MGLFQARNAGGFCNNADNHLGIFPEYKQAFTLSDFTDLIWISYVYYPIFSGITTSRLLYTRLIGAGPVHITYIFTSPEKQLLTHI